MISDAIRKAIETFTNDVLSDFSNYENSLNNLSTNSKIEPYIEGLIREGLVTHAISLKKFEIAKLLIQKWNMHNYIDCEGKELLMHAIDANNTDFIVYLLNNGNFVTKDTIEYITNINLPNECIVIKLLDSLGNEKISNDELKDTILKLLIRSIKNKYNKVAKMLIDNKVHLYYNPNISMDPLYTCIESNNIVIAQYLLDHKFNINSKFNYLKEATKYSNEDLLKLLLSYNIDIERFGEEAMKKALENYSLNYVTILHEAGIKINEICNIFTIEIKNSVNQFVEAVINLGIDKIEYYKIFHLALNSGNLYLAEFILKKIDIPLSFKDRYKMFKLKKIK